MTRCTPAIPLQTATGPQIAPGPHGSHFPMRTHSLPSALGPPVGTSLRSPRRLVDSTAPRARLSVTQYPFPPHAPAPSLPPRFHPLTRRPHLSSPSFLLSFSNAQRPPEHLAGDHTRALHGTPPRDPQLPPLNATAPSLHLISPPQPPRTLTPPHRQAPPRRSYAPPRTRCSAAPQPRRATPGASL
jgi:hypothetical protein